MSQFPVINPAETLPIPEAISPLDFEALFQQFITKFVELDPTFDASSLEVDPGVTLGQAYAYLRLLDRANINDVFRAGTLSMATGANLDARAADRGVRRLLRAAAEGDTPAVYESDDNLRLRTWLRMQTWGSGSALGIEYHARTRGFPWVSDAKVIDHPGEGTLDLILLPAPAAELPENFDFADVVSEVGAYVMDRARRPGSISISTSAAQPVTVPATGVVQIRRGASANRVLLAAEASWRSFMAKTRRIGEDVPYSAVDAAVHVADVVSYHPTGGAVDVPISPTQGAEAGAWNVTAVIADE